MGILFSDLEDLSRFPVQSMIVMHSIKYLFKLLKWILNFASDHIVISVLFQLIGQTFFPIILK